MTNWITPGCVNPVSTIEVHTITESSLYSIKTTHTFILVTNLYFIEILVLFSEFLKKFTV